MRFAAIAIAAALTLADLASAVALRANADDRRATRTPVLVELFTSEGCSSCPPADTLLSRLVADQPLDGVEIVGLSLHVDYWNRLGWVDPFSKSDFTTRQNDYAAIWGAAQIYTPQAVVDGTQQVVGSDAVAVGRLVVAAASTPKPRVDLNIEVNYTDRVTLRIVVAPSSPRADKVNLLAVVAEDGLVSAVTNGENANRTLSHAGVVRSLQRVARFDAVKGVETTATFKLDRSWRRDRLRFVAFAQDPVSHAVLAIAQHPLT